jgi:nicotinate (nicotinamide) nucleotide adenylyltransferase
MSKRRASSHAHDAPVTPAPVPAGVKTVLVFGGSFDPPHYYHTVGPLVVVMQVFSQSGWLLYVPAAKSPLKGHGPVASDDHRIAMLKLGLDIPGRRSIWTDELDRAKWQRSHGGERPSYTIDTLLRLRSVLPSSTQLRLLIGSDQAAQFHKWKDPRAVIRLAEPLVMAREPIDRVSSLYSSLDSDFWTREERAAWCTRMAPNFPLPASSTSVRELIPRAPRTAASWKKVEGLSDITTPVAAYIIKHRLYGFNLQKRKGPELPRRAKLNPAEQALVSAASLEFKHGLKHVDSAKYPLSAVTSLEAPVKKTRAGGKPPARKSLRR